MSESRRSPLSRARDPRAFVEAGDMTPAETEAYQLFLLAEAGVQRVRLRAGASDDTAPECHETDGFEMTVDEAMLLQPIPHEVGPGVRCTCAYRPVE